MGSLGTDTDISDITYKNVYTWTSNQVSILVHLPKEVLSLIRCT